MEKVGKIRKVNGRAITEASEVQQIVGRSSVGDVLEVEVSRNGKDVTIPVRTAALPTQR